MTDIDLADPVALVRIIEAGARRLIRGRTDVASAYSRPLTKTGSR